MFVAEVVEIWVLMESGVEFLNFYRGLSMRRMVFRLLTPNTQHSKTSDRQQDNPDSLFQDNPDTIYKICGGAKVLLFYESPRQVEERYINSLYSEIDHQFSI